MTLAPADFASFYGDLHAGASPFAWQRRLLDSVLEAGCWPERIVAPTGAGKTAVIDVHIFAVALMAAAAGPRVPRRLALVVDRRALVDSQYDIAMRIVKALVNAPDGALLAEVASLLATLRRAREARTAPLDVVLLRGGVSPMRRWVDDPTAAGIICATPAMWGSRLLFRGYGTSRRARPREAGMLAYDTVLVVDEAHLARQLVATSRRVSVLDGMATEGLPVPRLQVVEATATLGDDRNPTERSVSVEPDDLESGDPASALLAKRLLAPKPVTLVPLGAWPPTTAAARLAIANRLADEAETLLSSYGGTVACVVNTVDTGLAAASVLRERGRTVELLVGRMRPHDAEALRRRRPGLLTIEGNRDVEVLVATQTVEVGLDADFSAMVTELAPGSALAQRAGRVNRLGVRPATEIRVLVPDGAMPAKGAPPYHANELEEGRDWLVRRATAPDGLAPYGVTLDPPPQAALPRVVLGRPEVHDARLLARTSDRLFAEPDLELWIADDLEPDEDISLVVRAGIGNGIVSDTALLQATPVQAHEGFPAPIRIVRSLMERDKDRDLPCHLLREEEWVPLDDPGILRPGDTLVIGTSARWFKSDVVVSADRETDKATDVLEDEAAPTVLRIGPEMPIAQVAGREVVTSLLVQLGAAAAEEPVDGRARRALMVAAIEAVLARQGSPIDVSTRDRLRWAGSLLRRRVADAAVTVAPIEGDEPPRWAVISDLRARPDEDVVRQTWAAVATPLDAHQRDVASRASEIAIDIGLTPALAEVLREAGALHDEGKRDTRFQRLLGRPMLGDPAAPALAKSGHRTPAEYRAAQTSCGLPVGWRHEQLSAVIASSGPSASVAMSRRRDLVTRLVGTSHGAGRVSFPHGAAALFGETARAQEVSAGVAEAIRLFDEGAWDVLAEATHRTYGFWGCAYLEGLLRAADAQVSREAEAASGGTDG